MAVWVRRTFCVLLMGFAAPLCAQRSSAPVDSTLGRIVFDVLETSRDTTVAPFMYILYRTENPLGCLLPLLARLSRGTRTFMLDEWVIDHEAICPSAVGPATGGVALPLELGSQVLTIRHRATDDRYELDVTAERIRIRALASPRISVTFDTSILRFPRNSFSATCDAERLTWICDGLFRAVEAEAGIQAVRLPRDGRNPFQRGSSYTVWNGSARYVPNDPMAAAPRVYHYRSLRDLDRVRTSMRQYREEAAGGHKGVSMGGRTWTGITW